MEELFAPWRMSYIKQAKQEGEPEGCFLCEAAACTPPSEESRQRLVLLRDERGVMLLNRFPYTNGHLLIAPSDHLPKLAELSSGQRANLMELTALAERLLQAAMDPQGINVGVNIGRAAGAGVPGHMHVHVVPRWGGDTNFMTVAGGIRVIPQALEHTHEELRDVLRRLGEEAPSGSDGAA
jgi:ATP adenylyltransferase